MLGFNDLLSSNTLNFLTNSFLVNIALQKSYVLPLSLASFYAPLFCKDHATL